MVVRGTGYPAGINIGSCVETVTDTGRGRSATAKIITRKKKKKKKKMGRSCYQVIMLYNLVLVTRAELQLVSNI